MSENLSPKKLAIILFNLGGPDKLSSVKPFLFNLFYDPAIIRYSKPLRWIIAKIISFLRNKKAQEIYSFIGGKSPILQQTEAQKDALTKKLAHYLNVDFTIFTCMRYWHPMSREVAKKVQEYKPTEIILLPLYPQFSTTTTASSIKEFKRWFPDETLALIKTICCYPINEEFIEAHILLIQKSLEKLANNNFRLLFSAHGLPVKIIKSGDPYQWQVEQTVKAVIAKLAIANLDYKVTYQSRVGPMEWLKPNTEDEIKIAGLQKKALIIVPIAFVSEHSETLVELDIEYRNIANKYQIQYIRVPALQVNDIFIDSLAKMVLNIAAVSSELVGSSNLKRICPPQFSSCPCAINK